MVWFAYSNQVKPFKRIYDFVGYEAYLLMRGVPVNTIAL
jgi:hypothetical protein